MRKKVRQLMLNLCSVFYLEKLKPTLTGYTVKHNKIIKIECESTTFYIDFIYTYDTWRVDLLEKPKF